MQSKRQQIIEILKVRGSATVEELSKELGITSVTVRHHIDVLRSDGLVSEPMVRHRSTSGRPLHTYSLTSRADDLFPKNYNSLVAQLLDEVKARFDAREVNVLFEGMTGRLLADAPQPVDGDTVAERFDRAIQFLNQRGYFARWERTPEGIVLHTCNCPYEGLAGKHPELCSMDINLIVGLTGFVPERVCHITEGGDSCSYLIREGALLASPLLA